MFQKCFLDWQPNNWNGTIVIKLQNVAEHIAFQVAAILFLNLAALGF